jgi:hypothetical protein
VAASVERRLGQPYYSALVTRWSRARNARAWRRLRPISARPRRRSRQAACDKFSRRLKAIGAVFTLFVTADRKGAVGQHRRGFESVRATAYSFVLVYSAVPVRQ